MLNIYTKRLSTADPLLLENNRVVFLIIGILTGSVYKDYGLLWNGLYGESVINESVSVVKTHEWGPSTRKIFNKAILLIRSPGPAIQAEFNRRSGGHLGYASIDRFTRNDGKGSTSLYIFQH